MSIMVAVLVGIVTLNLTGDQPGLLLTEAFGAPGDLNENFQQLACDRRPLHRRLAGSAGLTGSGDQAPAGPKPNLR
jgi:hypothetical protein